MVHAGPYLLEQLLLLDELAWHSLGLSWIDDGLHQDLDFLCFIKASGELQASAFGRHFLWGALVATQVEAEHTDGRLCDTSGTLHTRRRLSSDSGALPMRFSRWFCASPSTSASSRHARAAHAAEPGNLGQLLRFPLIGCFLGSIGKPLNLALRLGSTRRLGGFFSRRSRRLGGIATFLGFLFFIVLVFIVIVALLLLVFLVLFILLAFPEDAPKY